MSTLLFAPPTETMRSGEKLQASMANANDPVLGPFDKRNEALDAELEFLNMMLGESEPLDEHLAP